MGLLLENTVWLLQGFWVEVGSCYAWTVSPFQIQVPLNVALFGDLVTEEVISQDEVLLAQSGPPIPRNWRPCMKRMGRPWWSSG